ncbi:hypothetical protein ACOSP7_018438 [Xanthoceras sorbifolium]
MKRSSQEVISPSLSASVIASPRAFSEPYNEAVSKCLCDLDPRDAFCYFDSPVLSADIEEPFVFAASPQSMVTNRLVEKITESAICLKRARGEETPDPVDSCFQVEVNMDSLKPKADISNADFKEAASKLKEVVLVITQ